MGDYILAIDDTSFEHVTVAEATQILKCSTGSNVRIEMVPVRHLTSQSQHSSLERDQQHLPPPPPELLNPPLATAGVNSNTKQYPMNSSPNFTPPPTIQRHQTFGHNNAAANRNPFRDLSSAKQVLEDAMAGHVSRAPADECDHVVHNRNNNHASDHNRAANNVHHAEVHSSQTSLQSFG